MGIFNMNNLKRAYRKYKSMTYYDTYGAINREKVASFEIKNKIQENDIYFDDLSTLLNDEKKRKKCFDDIVSQINVRCYPKKMKSIETSELSIISNELSQNTEIESMQYFIDMPVEGHILGVLWVVEYGSYLDGKLIDNCFGNRLKPYIKKEAARKSISPFLFYPYFTKYERWRDDALDVIKQQLDGKRDALMISLDIKSYYYNARVDFNEICNQLEEFPGNKKESTILINFIERVFKTYTKLFKPSNKVIKCDYPFIPIGFAPSMVISNWFLDEFDRKVLKDLHPIYYGRYVDDFLIVLPHYSNAVDFKNMKDVIETYFTKTKKYPRHDFFKTNSQSKKKEKDLVYRFIDKKYRHLSIQMKKFKVYVFKHNESQAMINNFRREINHTSSEFRYMFEKDSISKHIDDEIYQIDYEDTINKIRSIQGIKVDKFRLSKTLTKLIYASVENEYKDKSEMFESLVNVFSNGRGIDLFILWEKMILLLFMQKKYDEILNFCITLTELIGKINFKKTEETNIYLQLDNEENNIKLTLRQSLFNSLLRTFSLRCDPQVEDLDARLRRKISTYKDFVINNQTNYREKYLLSQLINSKIIMMPIKKYDCLFLQNTLKKRDYDLIFNYVDITSNAELKYFPRYVQLHECFLYYINSKIEEGNIVEKTDYFTESLELYKKINYMPEDGVNLLNVKENDFFSLGLQSSGNVSGVMDDVTVNEIKVGKEKFDSLSVGIASVKIEEENLVKAWKGIPNVSISRMDALINIVNLAIKQNVQFLVMPECYIPYCWIAQMIEVARKHNIAMVFGVEHIVRNEIVYNYIMTVLPVVVDGYNNCVVKMRLKNFYSPEEEKNIRAYHLNIPLRKYNEREYDLFTWNGINFATYNCYELTHITDRALFKSRVDMIVACEDNKDTAYFSSIIDSLAVDIHCYCIQVNAAQYGDSKITQPKGSIEKTILSIKGGDNDFMIVGNVKIKLLREFQIRATSGNDASEKTFKPLPPGFNYRMVRKRMQLD